jgi:hypothetical protein
VGGVRHVRLLLAGRVLRRGERGVTTNPLPSVARRAAVDLEDERGEIARLAWSTSAPNTRLVT